MADLDDFFSKRDKKKKSKGQKFETTGLDDVAKILDAKVKERKKQETNKSTYQVPASDGTEQLLPSDYRAQEDDEWKEHVEQKPDYTGLKIQELVLEDEDEIGGKDANGQEDGDKPREGPWRKDKVPPPAPAPTPVAQIENLTEKPLDPISLQTDESPAPLAESKPEIEVAAPVSRVENPAIPDQPKTEPEAPKKSGYVPPAVRKAREAEEKRAAELAAAIASAAPTIARPPISSINSASTPDSAPAPKLQSGTGGAYLPPSKRGGVPSSTSSTGSTKPKKHVAAPNINDEQYFPSLGETKQS